MILDTKLETPYAVAKLESAARVIKQAINELPTLRKRLEKNKEDKNKAREIYSDLKVLHRKLNNALDETILPLLEVECDELANHSIKLGQSIKSFNLMTPDYTKLCAALNSYLAKLPLTDSIDIYDENADGEIKTTNNRIIGRLMNNVRMGYYPTCPDNLSHIIQGIDFPEDVTLNLLDPCCGCGLALRSLAEGISNSGGNCKTYGIELDNYRAEESCK